MPHHSRIRRNGLTHIELICLISVLAILIALLIPAVQKVRDLARREHCASNLKQIGLALHAYADAHKVFPPAIINSPESKAAFADGSYTPEQALGTTGWLLLLPNLNQVDLHKQYNFNYGAAPRTVGYPEQEAARSNQEITGRKLTMLLCPADVPSSLANNATVPGICVNAMKSNYLFAAGGSFNASPNAPDINPDVPYNEAAPVYGKLFALDSTSMGMFGNDGAITMFGLGMEGRSSVIMVGESLQNHAGGEATAVVWGQGKLHGQMAVVDGIRTPETKTTMNYPRTASDLRAAVAPGILSSEHPGGINVVMGDGSVRFLKQGIDFGIYSTLFMIRDGAAVPDSF